ncbi:formate dehydrogenase subunit delta [Pontibaca methylaminivorans]|uniref:formate dehydrogenase subunit delta n=1 Tax=Pontibaca methylaminivorans TaxID=515897 RepID=UPI002FD8E283
MSPEKMVTMANQIAMFMETAMPADEAAAGVAGHINDFGEPRMRRQLLAYLESGGEDLRPLVIEAATQIRCPAADA